MAKENASRWVGFDLGGTKMLAVVYDESFKPLGQKRRKTKGFEGMKTGLERMARTIDDALAEAGLSRDALSGIGFGCPGPVDFEKGVVLEMPNLGWDKVPIRKHFEGMYGCPVAVSNDVDAGLFGEFRFGAAKNARSVAGIFPGTGIGGAFVYEGRILRGKNISCMEIGHIPLLPEGALSGTGQHGTLEAIASRLAVSAAAASAAYRGDAPHLLEKAGTDLQEIRSSLLAEAIAAGDKAVEDVLRDAAKWIGRALTTVVYLLAPEVLVLGGGLVEALPKLFEEEVRRELKSNLMPAFQDTYRIAIAQLGDYATVAGAAAWAAETLGSAKT